MTTKPKYPGCFYCDNLVDYPDYIALLHIGFPRCFVWVRRVEDFLFSDYDQFVANIAEINWLDPGDKGTKEEQEEILIKLWNFAIEQEEIEDNMVSDIEF